MNIVVEDPLQEKQGNGYRVETIGNCRIVYGAVPMSQFSALTQGFSAEAKIATDIANRIGASFVIGEITDIEKLRTMNLPVGADRQADFMAAIELGHLKAAMWLRNGERGNSSNAMCKRLFGVPAQAGIDHPMDADDLRRCLLFLDATDSHHKVHMMAGVSKEWKALSHLWEDLINLLKAEMDSRKPAKETCALMQEILRV